MHDSPRGILNCVCLELRIDACHCCPSNTFKKNSKSLDAWFIFSSAPTLERNDHHGEVEILQTRSQQIWIEDSFSLITCMTLD